MSASARFPPIAVIIIVVHASTMRFPTKTDLKHSLWSTFKGIATMTIILVVAVFSPIWDWSGYPRPNVEIFVARLLILLGVLTPILMLTALLNEISDDQAA